VLGKEEVWGKVRRLVSRKGDEESTMDETEPAESKQTSMPGFHDVILRPGWRGVEVPDFKFSRFFPNRKAKRRGGFPRWSSVEGEYVASEENPRELIVSAGGI